MAASLKLAHAYVDVEVVRTRFNSGLASIISDLGRLKGLGTINLTLNRTAATASLNLFRQQLESLQKAANVSIKMSQSGGGGTSGGGASAAGQLIGLSKLQMSGIALQDKLAKAKEQSAQRAAAAQDKADKAAQRSAAQQERADQRAAAKAAQQAAKGPEGMVGLGSLQMSGIALQDKLAKAKEQAALRASAAQDKAAKAQERADQITAARQQRDAAKLDAIQDRHIKKDYDRRVRAEAQAQRQNDRTWAAAVQKHDDAKQQARDDAGGGGGGRRSFSGMGGMAGQGAMGLAQGLGVGGLAFSPMQMAGQMAGGGLRDAVSTSMDLEATFIGLRRYTGESAENMEKFKRTIFDISKSQAGVSVKDLTDIAGAGAKAGITDKEGIAGLETFTRGMAKVRNSVQGMGTEQLANDMVRMLNLFHKGTEYVESFGSVLARMDNVSTSSAADILDISKSLSGTFHSLGMTIPQVMAFSSVLSDVGLTNQQGAGSFSQILRMMASKSEEMAEKIGMPVEQFQQAVRTNAMGALGMLIGKFRELNDVDPIKAQEFLVSLGFRGVKTAGALQQLSSMFEEVQRRTEMGIEEETNHGSLMAANALNSEAAIGNVQKLKNAFEELADSIGSKLVPHLTEASKVALSLVNNMIGGKAGGPAALTTGERLERLRLNTQDPFKMNPEMQKRITELDRKEVEYTAYQNNQPLSAAAPAAQEQIKALEKSIQAAPPELKPKMEAALAALRGGLPPGEVSPEEAKARAGRGGILARPAGGPPESLALPGVGESDLDVFSGRKTDIGKSLESAMSQAGRAAAEAMKKAGVTEPITSGAMLGRRTPGMRGVDEVAEDKTFAAYTKRRESEAEAKELKAQEKRNKKFQSQTFSGGDDFASSFITGLLEKDRKLDETPKLQLDEQKLATKLLQDMRDRIMSPAVKDAVAVFSGKA